MQPIGIISLILLTLCGNLLWLALIHQNRGNKFGKEMKNSTGINFSTNTGDFRIDKVQQNFKYKLKGETNWLVSHFEAITGIESVYSTDDAIWYEMFLSDWSLWDLSGKYRDVTHIASIELTMAGGARVPLVEIRQFEQREMWLGQYTYELQIRLLEKLGLYHPLEHVADQWIATLAEKCRCYGLELGSHTHHC